MLPKPSGWDRPAVLTLLLALGVLVTAGPATVAARPAEGGANSRTHKLLGPVRATIKCRICAGKRCTVVSVRGRCTKRRALAALETRLKQRSRRKKALPEPQLDDRSYKQLEKGSRRRIPQHTPEWTNLNDSDPGVTILQAARRNPRAVRVQRVPSAALPETDDEVMVDFEHGDSG